MREPYQDSGESWGLLPTYFSSRKHKIRFLKIAQVAKQVQVFLRVYEKPL